MAVHADRKHPLVRCLDVDRIERSRAEEDPVGVLLSVSIQPLAPCCQQILGSVQESQFGVGTIDPSHGSALVGTDNLQGDAVLQRAGIRADFDLRRIAHRTGWIHRSQTWHGQGDACRRQECPAPTHGFSQCLLPMKHGSVQSREGGSHAACRCAWAPRHWAPAVRAMLLTPGSRCLSPPPCFRITCWRSSQPCRGPAPQESHG